VGLGAVDARRRVSLQANGAACLVLIHGLARTGKLGGDAALLIAIPASCEEDAGTCGQQNEKLRHS
jgi:hypothetical protein